VAPRDQPPRPDEAADRPGVLICRPEGAIVSNHDDYRRNAFDCIRLAQAAVNPRDKAMLVGMAQTWIRLAERAQKNGLADSVYEAPSASGRKRPYRTCGDELGAGSADRDEFVPSCGSKSAGKTWLGSGTAACGSLEQKRNGKYVCRKRAKFFRGFESSFTVIVYDANGESDAADFDLQIKP
jgi:hypothetical protein